VNKTRVLVVDDSALVRKLLSEIINSQNDMVCVGTANDPLIAREMIRELNPDVLTLDVEMPRMDGIEFLSRTMRALELGAVDFVAKPRIGLTDGIKELSTQIVEKIRVATVARVSRAAPLASAAGHAPVQPVTGVATGSLRGISTEKIICIGASTGGTEAIREVLTKMPADSPAIVITQHMPPGFTTSFAARLDTLCEIVVKEAAHGERILPGHAYIAPGGKQFSLNRSGANYIAVVEDGEPVNRHKPSVEVLFKSAATVAGRNVFGIMLTGMGNDGAQAMREMKDAGSYNYVQNEASCIVFGMPREAILHGAADEVLPLTDIAPALLGRLRGSADRYRI